MKKSSFPLLALGLGVMLRLTLLAGGSDNPENAMALPLLTLLVISEFGMFVTGAGAWLGTKNLVHSGIKPAGLIVTVGCGLLSLDFLAQGIRYWPL